MGRLGLDCQIQTHYAGFGNPARAKPTSGGTYSELAAMEVYLTEAILYPFEAIWRDPDEPGHHESVTIRSFAETDERRGVLLAAEISQRKRRILAEQIWPVDGTSANATVLNDYRYWVNNLNGLTPGFG